MAEPFRSGMRSSGKGDRPPFPQVEVELYQSCIRDSSLSQTCHLPACHQVSAEALCCLVLPTGTYQAGCFSAVSEANGDCLRL